MPRTPKTPKTPTTDIKPYCRSSESPSPGSSGSAPSSDLKPGIKSNGVSKSPRKARDPSKAKPWTNEQYLQLIEKVAKAGMGRSTWEGAVDDRTPNQCYQAWIGTVVPFIKKALAEKAKR